MKIDCFNRTLLTYPLFLIYSRQVLMKKFAAIVMTLLLAGQALAGVCDCLGGDDGHSCCEKNEELTLKRPPCCDEGDCLTAIEIPQTASAIGALRFETLPVTHSPRYSSTPFDLQIGVVDHSPDDRLLRGSPPSVKQPLFITLHRLLI